jgi:hypothetical protein
MMKASIISSTSGFLLAAAFVLSFIIYIPSTHAQRSLKTKNILERTDSLCCISTYSVSQFDSLNLEQLGAEYKRLKSLNCQYCSRFRSHYMLVMEQLGTKLNGESRKAIKRVMGKPDERERNKLIYQWRGGHDYLYFTFNHGSAGKSNWYYAYE